MSNQKIKIEISKSAPTCQIINIQKVFQHVESFFFFFFKKCFNMSNQKIKKNQKSKTSQKIHNNNKKVFRHVESKNQKMFRHVE